MKIQKNIKLKELILKISELAQYFFDLTVDIELILEV